MGRTYSGIKRLFLPCCIKENFMPISPCCIKGKFYANLALLYLKTSFYAKFFGIKRPCVNPVRSPIYPRYYIHKGRFYAKCCN